MSSGTVLRDLRPGGVAVVGIPLDENSSFLRGPALGPERIREVLHSGSTNLCTEAGVDLGNRPDWCDVGNLVLPDGAAAMTEIEARIADLLENDLRVLSLGGDHSVTYPILRAYAKRHSRLNVLHLDAHPDLHDEFAGSRLSHACPFARILEECPEVRVTQVGIRALTPHQQGQAERFGVRIIDMRAWHPGLDLALGLGGRPGDANPGSRIVKRGSKRRFRSGILARYRILTRWGPTAPPAVKIRDWTPASPWE